MKLEIARTAVIFEQAAEALDTGKTAKAQDLGNLVIANALLGIWHELAQFNAHLVAIKTALETDPVAAPKSTRAKAGK